MRSRQVCMSAVFGVVLMSAGISGQVCADTPQQARQQIQHCIDRSVAAYNHKDLAGFMTLYAASYNIANIVGKRQDYLQVQAETARSFTTRLYFSRHIVLRTVTVDGNLAYGILEDHVVERQTSHLPKYAGRRDVVENVGWEKDRSGWHEVTVQMLQDTTAFQRL